MGVTVTEDVSVKVSAQLLDIFDSVGVAEDVERNLLCLIKPTTEAVKLWSKLEDAGDVTSPDVGTGGAEVGSPTYEAAKFGNGILSNIDNEGCTFPTVANSINGNKGTIEFWAKLNYAPSGLYLQWLFTFRAADMQNGIFLYFSKYSDDFELKVCRGGAIVAVAVSVGMSWNIGDILHFGCSWDREGNDLGDSKTLVLYIDNVLKASSSTTWDAITGIGANLVLGTTSTGTYHSDAVIDNIKTYDTCKIDFSGRNTEGLATAGPVESVSLVESITSRLRPFIDVYDSPSLAEYLKMKYPGPRDIDAYDSVEVAEDVISRLVSKISVFDASVLTEYLRFTGRLGNVDVNETPSVSEALVMNLINLISEYEEVTVVEVTSALAIVAGISVYEAVSVLERIYLEWWLGITKDDTVWSDITKEDTIWSDVTKEDTVWSDVR